MASEDLVPLITAGPFLGLDLTTAPLWMKPGFARAASNVNTQIIKGALAPERGRVNIFDATAEDFGGNLLSEITCVFPCVAGFNVPLLLCCGPSQNTGHRIAFLYNLTDGTFHNLAGDDPTFGPYLFTQCVQYGAVVYTNAGTRLFIDGSGLPAQFYDWQYQAQPNAQDISVNWTYAITITIPSGVIQSGVTLTTTIDTTSGAQAIPYTIVDADIDFLILSQHIADAINAYYSSGGGAADPNKVTASVYTNFDTASNPGSITPNSSVGVLITSNASGLIGNTFTIAATSSSTQTTYAVQAPPVPWPAGFFYGADNNVGSIGGGAYFYLFTQTTTMPDGTISETSPLPADYANPLQLNIGAKTYGFDSAVTFTEAVGGYLFTAMNPDGTTYTTNIYRASAQTSSFEYQLVGNKADNATPFVDTIAQADLAGNAVLQVHRDEPPVSSTNLGFICIHQNRIWALVLVDNSVTLNVPQAQLWWSNFARPWEFDDVDQVALVNSDVTVQAQSGSGTTTYDSLYGNMPKGLVEVGTTLIAKMHRLNWVVWGDGVSSGGTIANPYIIKPITTHGLASQYAILPALGGEFSITRSGDVYFYEGNGPEYVSEDIRGALKLTSINANVNATDLTNACLSYSNQVLYVSFPTKNFTLGYDLISKSWTSQLPYAPATSAGIYSTPGNPTTYAGNALDEVIAVRHGVPAAVDWWFADPNSDLGSFMLYSWTTPQGDSGKSDYMKWYKIVRITAPKQQGAVTVSVTVDNGDDPSQTFSRTFDLSKPQIKQTKVLKGHTESAIGYLATMTITVQGVAGQPSPYIEKVEVFGVLGKHLLVQDDEDG